MCIWTCSVQNNTRHCDIHVDDPLNPILGLYYFIHEICWYTIRLGWRHVNPFGVLSSSGGWSVPLRIWAIVIFQTACRGFAWAEIFISFFACVTCFWCLSSIWWCFQAIEYSSFYTSVYLFLFPLFTFGAFPVFWSNPAFVDLRMKFVPLTDTKLRFHHHSLDQWWSSLRQTKATFCAGLPSISSVVNTI